MEELSGSGLTISGEGKDVSNNSNYNFNHAKANVSVRGGGKWYYEATIQSNGQLLVGFASEQWTLSSNNTQSLGNDSESWAYDGYIGNSLHCGKFLPYGKNYWFLLLVFFFFAWKTNNQVFV